MSVGGEFSEALNSSVQAAVAAGVVVVTASGNSNTDACSVSPAAEPAAITVGATSRNDVRSVSKSHFLPLALHLFCVFFFASLSNTPAFSPAFKRTIQTMVRA